ncbi:MAG: isoprenylcysteine carboxylmethyltransferase family protein [Candidatus Omnitrophica bacterium]|nr:isoprenylcysteine carboxylmethyltransferase family protein [Candidatus Omnitrophota bacterium]
MIFTIFFGVFVIVATAERVKTTFQNKQPISGRKWITVVPIITYVGIIVLGIAEYFYIARQMNYYVSITGLLIYLGGVILRKSAISVFRGDWNMHVDAQSIKSILTSGPYKFVRHPYSLAVLFELTGFLLLANSYTMLLAIFVIQYPLLVLRSNFEEIALIKKFGKEYAGYRKRVITVFPVIRIV